MTDDAVTKPTIDALLKRINDIGGLLTERINDSQKQVEREFSKLDSKITALHGDVRKVDRKLEILNDNILNVQADHRDLLVRVEDLESKAS